MKKKKLTKNDLKDSRLGRASLRAQQLSKDWALLDKKLERCLVKTLEGSKPIVDPYYFRPLLKELMAQPTVAEGLGAELVSELEQWSDVESRKIENSFEARLLRFCERENIDVEGHFPSYVLQGFLIVQVIPKDGICKIGERKLKTLLLDSLAPVITKAIREEARRPFDESRFLEELFSSYSRSIALKKVNEGDPIPIKDVFQELIFVKQPPKFKKSPLKSNYQEYSMELFKRDLARVMKSGSNLTKSGKRLGLTPTSFATEGVPILSDGAIRYIGRLAFQEASAE